VNFSGNASFDGVGTAIGGEDQCVTAPVFAPVIDLQPKSQRVGLSGAVTLSVSASGVGALTYQWAKDGVDLPGETKSVLSLTEIETSDAGEYRVAVTDSLGTVVSDVARLTVSLSNATRALPETFSQGVLAVITIEANPESGVLTYAVEETPPAGWSIGAINEGGVYDGISGTVKWGPFFDGSARTLTYEASAPTTGSGSASFQGVASFDGFSVVIGGDAQRSVSGDVAPIIVTQPANQNLFLGSNATLCVGAAGSGVLSYQWAKDGIDLPGETSRCLNLSDIEPGDSGEYRVAVTDSRGTTVSQGARLVVALSSATRTLPEDCLEGRPTPVTIEARPEANVLSYAIEETPPAGWSIEVINEGGVYDATTGSVKWGPFFDAQPRTLTYEASAPTGATGMGRFEGVASYDGFSAPIAGNAQCRVISSTCLEIGLRDGFVVIEFCKPKLYSAESVAGPFKEIVGASSPYLAPITDTQKFFMAMD